LTWERASIIFPYCMHSKKPRIGITVSEALEQDSYRWPSRRSFDYLKHEYFQAVMLAGGLPILLPNVEPPSLLYDLVDSIDGLLLTGGGDMHPNNYGQVAHEKLKEIANRRDQVELAVIDRVMKADKPILGICRGHQVLNIALGGTLYQDLSSFPGQTLRHADPEQTGAIFHSVTLKEGSKLYGAIGAKSIDANSSHHQAANKLGKGLTAVAYAPDGVCEAIEHGESDFVIGVQWHPEAIIDRGHSRKLFEAFIGSASRRI